ncbi:DoxX family membrane protein [Clostridium chromiireducens]|jgi:DoxX.|uniref:DoxX family membrane protein n=1 Tax=Clostridium chromiireducens TaxID=225345 RepID=A0A964RLD2_9CLOT|nr:DoxX family membrane protein [Clostridium chromiireducens]MVX63680.1 DoxX family membrane protein [Clostridium chromiireducens]
MNIFKNKYLIPIWTVLRVWLGFQWLIPGLEKIKDPTWVGSEAGVAITGFLKGALAKSTGDHPAVQWWYARFVESVALPNANIFTYLVPYGEVLVGISLILGAFTIVGLLGGAFMNLNYLLAGTTSTNPILYTVAIILIVAGVNAYKIGVDKFLIEYWNKKHGKSLKSVR